MAGLRRMGRGQWLLSEEEGQQAHECSEVYKSIKCSNLYAECYDPAECYEVYKSIKCSNL